MTEIPHVTILKAIREILESSNAPHSTVKICIQFVDSLIEQSTKKPEEVQDAAVQT